VILVKKNQENVLLVKLTDKTHQNVLVSTDIMKMELLVKNVLKNVMDVLLKIPVKNVPPSESIHHLVPVQKPTMMTDQPIVLLVDSDVLPVPIKATVSLVPP